MLTTRPLLIGQAFAFLKSKGLRLAPRDEATLLHRAFWQMGIALAPPAFATPFANMVVLGVAFEMSWGALVCVVTLLIDGNISSLAAWSMVAAAVCIGMIRAYQFKALQRAFDLPTWRAFKQATSNAEAQV